MQNAGGKDNGLAGIVSENLLVGLPAGVADGSCRSPRPSPRKWIPRPRKDIVVFGNAAPDALEEAGVEQVQNGVLDPADVFGRWPQPLVGDGRIDGLRGILCAEVAKEILGGVDEGIHGVGLAGGRFPTRRACMSQSRKRKFCDYLPLSVRGGIKSKSRA